MPARLSVHVKTAFVMTAEVEKSSATRSGFHCAEIQWSTRGLNSARLFSDLRFRGVAAMTRLGFADRVTIIGGQEDRYPSENISRSEAFKAILEKDFGAVGDIVAYGQSGTTMTADAFAVISNQIGNDNPENYAVISSKYHLARIEAQMGQKGLRLVQRWPAEAFLLAEDEHRFKLMLDAFGDDDLAFREMLELRGIAAILTGSYRSLPVTK